MPQPTGSSWVDMMNQQDQNIPERMTPAEGGSGSLVPDFGTGDPEADAAIAYGMQVGSTPDVQRQLAKGKSASSIAREIRTRSRGPMGEEAVSQDMLAQDRIKQANDLSAQSLNEQKAGIQQLDDHIKQVGGIPQKMDYTALAGFAKFLNPQNDFTAQAAALRPETPEARSEKLLGLQEKLQQRKSDFTKQNLESLKSQIDAYKAGKDNSLDEELKKAKIGFFGSGRQDLQNQRLDFGMHKDIVGKIKTDKVLGSRLTQFSNLQNALTAVEKPDVTPVQQVAELQQAIRKNMGIGGSSGVSERSHTYMDSVGMNAAGFQQFLTGDPVDVAKNHPELLNHIKQVARIEMEQIAKQKDSRLKTLTAGADETVYARNPKMKRDLDSAAQAAGAQFADDAASTPASGGEIPPIKGEARDGYVFKGGDPADSANWEKK